MTLRKFLRFFKHFPRYMAKDFRWLKNKLFGKKEKKTAVIEKEEKVENPITQPTAPEIFEKTIWDFITNLREKNIFYDTEKKALYRRFPSKNRRVYLLTSIDTANGSYTYIFEPTDQKYSKSTFTATSSLEEVIAEINK